MQVANPKKGKKAVVTREFTGQEQAEFVVSWLNNPARPANDAVEQFIAIENRYRNGVDLKAGQESVDFIANVVRRGRLGMAPSANYSRLDGRTIKWVATSNPGRVRVDQADAFLKAIELADKNLLTRVRRCKLEGCGLWFFGKFEHSVYHSDECRIKAGSSTEEFRERRREYMKQRRKRQLKGKAQ